MLSIKCQPKVVMEMIFGELTPSSCQVMEMIWTGCSNGLFVQWDGIGYRLQDFQHHSSSFDTRLWVGYMSGTVQVLILKTIFLKVIKMVVGGGYIFTVANSGGIRA